MADLPDLLPGVVEVFNDYLGLSSRFSAEDKKELFEASPCSCLLANHSSNMYIARTCLSFLLREIWETPPPTDLWAGRAGAFERRIPAESDSRDEMQKNHGESVPLGEHSETTTRLGDQTAGRAFVKYATQHWITHYQLEGIQSSAEDDI